MSAPSPQSARGTKAASRLERRRRDPAALAERLVAVGVSETTADELVDEYAPRQISDALDALAEAGDEVHSRAGWVVSAIREGWDLDHLLAERREQEARQRYWEQQEQARHRQDAAQRARDVKTARWSAAISDALDDCHLALAIERLTTPVAGLDRRSVAVTRAQILAWALAASERHAELPLADALADDLEAGTTRAISLRGELPDAPAVDPARDDLHQRISALFETRPLLERPDLGRRAFRRLPARDLGMSLDR